MQNAKGTYLVSSTIGIMPIGLSPCTTVPMETNQSDRHHALAFNANITNIMSIVHETILVIHLLALASQ